MDNRRIYITLLISFFLHFGLIYGLLDLKFCSLKPLPSKSLPAITQISFYNSKIIPDTNCRQASSSSSSAIKESLPVILEEKEDLSITTEPKAISLKKEDAGISRKNKAREQLDKLKKEQAKKEFQFHNDQKKNEAKEARDGQQIRKETSNINGQNTAEQILTDEPKEKGIIQEEIQDNQPTVWAEPVSNSKSNLNKSHGIGETSVAQEEPLDLTGGFSDRKNITPPDIIVYKSPVYPEKLRKREIEGKVKLKVLINREGRAVQIRIAVSSGYRSFDQTALESVKRWQFSPARIGEKIRESWVIIPVAFRLK